ncbi:MAG: PIN domain-containing protein [Rhodoferax ferrireducens]|uniref:PIN domain-containing protein n=1 Tax=Rhodoferax ferrireducens TaxID=192843 RepID=A0A1W9KNR0_9BURK|nr:MAG: PIN domain-containing protein [Rhodoferax ferrireducens]
MAGSSRYTAILDANVLYPNLLRDILLSLAAAGLYHARWTARINAEWTLNLVANRPDIAPKIELLLEQVNLAVPDCLVEDYEFLIDSLVLPDADDRHVLAAAIVGHADSIVTSNLKDFPEKVMAQYDIEAQHPDDFIMNQLELKPFEALEVFKRVRAKRRNPACSASELIDMVEKNGLPQTAQHLRLRVGLI